MKHRSSKVVRATRNGFAAGYALSPLLTEFYVHRMLAHDTYKMHPKLKAACWLTTRLTGFNPSAWALKHRMHHSPSDKQEPSSPLRAAYLAVRSGIGSKKYSDQVLSNRDNYPHIRFQGSEGTDPLLVQAGEDLKMRYQNQLDTRLSEHPLLEKAIPLAIVAAGTLLRRRIKGESTIRALSVVGGAAGGFVAGVYGPGAVAAAYPERRDGYASSSEAGRDMGAIGQIIFGSYALHASHHREPHLSEAPNCSPFNHDRPVDLALQTLGLGQPVDGISA